MRPPEFTGGNFSAPRAALAHTPRFNEAAGIHRRKLSPGNRRANRAQAASMRPPEFTGGNGARVLCADGVPVDASMRPPEFTGGNEVEGELPTSDSSGFNEAAGIHRRKHDRSRSPVLRTFIDASMRPPEFTGGNQRTARSSARAGEFCFNEAAGIHRRKRIMRKLYRYRAGKASMRPPEFTGGNGDSFSINTGTIQMLQ